MEFWKRSQICDDSCAESFRLHETIVDRGKIVFRRKLRLLSVDRANPIGKRLLWRDFAAQARVVKMAMRVDQSRQQRLVAKIDRFTGIARFDLIKLSNIDNAIFGNHDRAVVDGWSIHCHDRARTNDHSPFITFRHSAINRLHASWQSRGIVAAVVLFAVASAHADDGALAAA